MYCRVLAAAAARRGEQVGACLPKQPTAPGNKDARYLFAAFCSRRLVQLHLGIVQSHLAHCKVLHYAAPWG